MKGRQNYYVPADKVKYLMFLCWLAYFANYLGRHNYSAVLPEILNAQAYSQATLGLVSTGFFVCYGVGQLLCGLVGDYVPPQWMVFFGVLISGLCNLMMGLSTSAEMMVAIWCVNGAVQSMIWSPIIRMIAEWMPLKARKKGCVNMSYTYPAGVLSIYALTAILLNFFQWQSIFWVVSVVMIVVSFLWLGGTRKLDKARTYQPDEEAPVAAAKAAAPIAAQPLHKVKGIVPLFILMSLALTLQGALRDGVMTWVPTYINQSFGLEVTISIFCSMALPVINLLGVEAGNVLTRKGMNEMKVSALSYAVAAAAALAMVVMGNVHVILTSVLFSMVTSAMAAINLMLVNMGPTYFVKWGKVSFVSGFFNSMVYLGSSLATWVIGSLTEAFGWNLLLTLLAVMSCVGLGFTLILLPMWKRFKES
ncbi:MAG: MFS transporter [Clostridia bacterium]|nr:MFS transporter [Clostridia bacterium]